MSALQTQNSVRFAGFKNQSRHERVHAALARPDAVRMFFVEGKKMTPILQDNSGLRLDHAGAKTHEVALNERDEISLGVDRRDVLRIRSRWHGRAFARRFAELNLFAHRFYALCRE